MQRLDIGAAKPIDGDLVWKVGRYLENEPPFVLLYDASRTALHARYRLRRLRGVAPELVVQQLGGDALFGRIEIPRWGTAWIRRSMVLAVESMGPEELRLAGGATAGARILMRFTPPLEQYPFLPPDTPYGGGAAGVSVDQVRQILLPGAR